MTEIINLFDKNVAERYRKEITLYYTQPRGYLFMMSVLNKTLLFFQKVGAKTQPILQWLPFTFGGAVFCLLSGMAAWFFGVQRSDFILIVIGTMGLVMSLLGVVLTWCCGFLLWRRFHLLESCTLTLREGMVHKQRSDIQVPWWIPLIQVSTQCIEDSITVVLDDDSEQITAHRRGVWRSLSRMVHVGDAFGICSISFVSVQPCHLRVLPKVVSPQTPSLLQGLQGGGEQAHPFGQPNGDRIDIRNYAVGDPVRFILWKVYARTGQLVVRTPEKAFEPVQRLLAYLIVHPSDSMAASLSSAILHSNTLGDNWAFGVDGQSEPCLDASTAIEAVVSSGNSVVQDGAGLADFVHQEAEATSLLIFAPPVFGEWLVEVEKVASRLPVQVCIVGQRPIKQSTLQSLLFLPEEPVLDQMDTAVVTSIVERLQIRGVSVTIVDPQLGQTFDLSSFVQQFGRKKVA